MELSAECTRDYMYVLNTSLINLRSVPKHLVMAYGVQATIAMLHTETQAYDVLGKRKSKFSQHNLNLQLFDLLITSLDAVLEQCN